MSLVSARVDILLSNESCILRISNSRRRICAIRSCFFKRVRDSACESAMIGDMDAGAEIVGRGNFGCTSSVCLISVNYVGFARSGPSQKVG